MSIIFYYYVFFSINVFLTINAFRSCSYHVHGRRLELFMSRAKPLRRGSRHGKTKKTKKKKKESDKPKLHMPPKYLAEMLSPPPRLLYKSTPLYLLPTRKEKREATRHCTHHHLLPRDRVSHPLLSLDLLSLIKNNKSELMNSKNNNKKNAEERMHA